MLINKPIEEDKDKDQIPRWAVKGFGIALILIACFCLTIAIIFIRQNRLN